MSIDAKTVSGIVIPFYYITQLYEKNNESSDTDHSYDEDKYEQIVLDYLLTVLFLADKKFNILLDYTYQKNNDDNIVIIYPIKCQVSADISTSSFGLYYSVDPINTLTLNQNEMDALFFIQEHFKCFYKQPSLITMVSVT